MSRRRADELGPGDKIADEHLDAPVVIRAVVVEDRSAELGHAALRTQQQPRRGGVRSHHRDQRIVDGVMHADRLVAFVMAI